MNARTWCVIGLFAATAALPNPASAQVSRVNPTFGVWTASTRGSAIAYDPRNDVYLAVSANGLVRGRFITADGAVSAARPEFVIQSSGNFTAFPRVAYSPDVDGGAGGFLVTWHEADASIASVHARTVSYTNGLGAVDNKLTGAESWHEEGPGVVYSTRSQEFLVVWHSRITGDVRGVRVGNTGAALGAVFTIGGSASFEDNPSVTYNPVTDEFMVAYAVITDTGPTTYTSGLSATRVKAGANQIVGTTPNVGSAVGIFITDITYNPSTGLYLATWYQDPPKAVYGRLLNADGSFAGNITPLSTRYAAYDALSVAQNGTSGTFFAVSHDSLPITYGGSVEDGGVEINRAGQPLTTGVQATAAGGTAGNFYPRIAAHTSRAEWMVVGAGSFIYTFAQRLQTGSRDGGGGPPPPPPPPPSPTCTININDNSTSIPGTTYTGGLSISTLAGCDWAAVAQAPWLSVSARGGSGPGSVQWTAQSNATGATRSATILIAGGSASRTLTVTQASLVVRLGDFNSDSNVDLIWQNQSTGNLALWKMNGFNLLTGDPLSPGIVADTGWKIVAALDIDKDGYSDLLWQHDSGYLSVWRMRGDTMVSGELITQTALTDKKWSVVGSGDIDKDGNADIIWQHRDGRVAVWYMRGTTLLAGEVIAESLSDQAWRVVGVADMNGDGHVDLMWHNSDTGAVAVWLMNRMHLTDARLLNDSAPDVNWHLRGLGDFDADGDVDVLWQNDSTGALAAWVMNGITVQNGLFLKMSVPDTRWKIVAPR